MGRYFIKLSYKGTNYHGWQIQDNANTVQAEVNKALTTILGKEISCTGCGRTDTGVHASAFYAHFDHGDSNSDIIYKLNGCLPEDIAIHNIYRMADEANSRFDAISRSYEYKIITKKDVCSGQFVYFHYKELNLELMKDCASLLLDHRDFSCFSKANTQTKTNDCDITEAEWIEGDQKLEFRITANRFLRGMVRAIVGTLLEIGEAKISKDDFVRILEGKDRSSAGYSVPAQGLFLTKVDYPEGYLGQIDEE